MNEIRDKLKNIGVYKDDTIEVIVEFLEKKRKNTVKGYITVLMLLADITGKDLMETNVGDIEKFREILDGKSNKTFNNYIAYLVALFKYLDSVYQTSLHRMVSGIPRKEVVYGLSERSVPTKADIEKVLIGLLESGKILEFVPLYMVLRCALSTSDIGGLTNNMIKYNGENFYVHFRASGQLKARDIVLPEDVTGTMREYIKRYRPDYAEDPKGNFFINNARRPLTDRALQLMLKKACMTVGVNPFTLNDMRNLGIPLLISAGKNWNEVAALTGTGTEWYMNRYSNLISRCHAESKSLKEKIRAFMPSYDEGNMDIETIAQYVGTLPWNVAKIIEEIQNE